MPDDLDAVAEGGREPDLRWDLALIVVSVGVGVLSFMIGSYGGMDLFHQGGGPHHQEPPWFPSRTWAVIGFWGCVLGLCTAAAATLCYLIGEGRDEVVEGVGAWRPRAKRGAAVLSLAASMALLVSTPAVVWRGVYNFQFGSPAPPALLVRLGALAIAAAFPAAALGVSALVWRRLSRAGR